MVLDKFKRIVSKCILPIVLCILSLSLIVMCLTGCQGLANANGHDNTVIVSRETSI